MQMLYDSESFVVVHLQTEAQAPIALSTGADHAKLDFSATKAAQTDGAAPAQPQHRLSRSGFEIVDKRSGKEVYLDGSWAELFQQQIIAWQVKIPSQDEVEETLESYAQLAQTPVVMH